LQHFIFIKSNFMSVSLTVRMYNQQNLGDCFLLTFKEGAKQSFVLIDCGSYTSGNDDREKEIAESILKTVGKNPVTVVLTHQHKDHLSGFISAADLFKDLNISELWFSYLDDPIGKEAKAMRKVTEQFWKKNKEAKTKAKSKFKGVAAVEKMLKAKDAIDLFAEEQTGGQAITNLLSWANTSPEFLLPGKNFDLPRLPKDSVKVYVLGPPTDPALLRKLDPSAGDAVVSLNAMSGMMSLDTSATLVLDALKAVTPGKDSEVTENFPFNKNFTYPMNDPTKTLWIQKEYIRSENDWRRIDYDWLSEMGRISLHMGNLTNNSSLVLAFELVAKKKVALFVADAQIGNWKSWMDLSFDGTDKDAKDLLGSTVFYKAGHHSSHNATLREGLDMMNEEELVIMIPVNEKVSTKMGFAMLQPGMLKGYNRKAQGRVLRADKVYHKPKAPKSYSHEFASKPTDFSPKIRVVPNVSDGNHLYIEYDVK
jgi:beta-lactamase superfamily II metal-dependent hydrolase